MRITVIGTGYVGLVSGVCFSELGNQVLCIDIDEHKVAKMKQGKSPIFEPLLEDLMKKNMEEARLDFSTDFRRGVEEAEVIFIAVGTPPKENGEADLQYVEKVAADIGKYLNEYKLIVTKSTVPVGTGQHLKEIIKENLTINTDFDIASNPEFLREGSAVKDTLEMERAVIGIESSKASELLTELHKPFNTTLVETNIETAEMIKYASNAFLATKISFINEMANICEKVGADVLKVAEGMGLDNRIGKSFLQAGLGYGGSCFPKDTNALIHIAKKAGYDMKIVPSVEEVNKQQRENFVKKIIDVFNGDLIGRKIAVMGLAFKPGTDDMRDAPSIDIINSLNKAGADVVSYDPVSVEEAAKVIPDLKIASSIEELLLNAEAAVVVTDWKEFKELDFTKIASLMKHKVIIDGRNMYNPYQMERLGFNYISVGRPIVGKKVFE